MLHIEYCMFDDIHPKCGLGDQDFLNWFKYSEKHYKCYFCDNDGFAYQLCANIVINANLCVITINASLDEHLTALLDPY